MAVKLAEFDENEMRIRRQRRSLRSLDRDAIAKRVLDFVQLDETERTEDMDLRLQRYAKFRMWTDQGSDWPWEGSSNQGLPDMMTDVLSMEDTLHNAVMSNRPLANARALQKHDEEKQDKIDDLLDTQVFIEQDGETALGETASCFVMDGVFTAYIPWVREDRKMSIYRTFKGFEPDEIPLQRFEKIIQQEFPQQEHQAFQKDEEGWDWEIVDSKEQVFKVKFYTDMDGEIEMVGMKSVRVYDGPKIIVKDYEDVLYPARSANLQIPGPSNPGGATHVILIDYPSVDEIQRLVDSGFYDLVNKKDLASIVSSSDSVDSQYDDMKRQKDVFQGRHEHQEPEDDSHKTLTRYLCFDLYDVDGDGINTDMMWWVLKEPRLLLKAKPLTEMYPSQPPRRPLAEANMIPVKGRREGIGLLEMMEPLHNFKKQIFDQVVDAGTLGNMPIWFYRPTSSIKPEVMRMFPGDGMPLTNPKEDVFFPNIGAGQATSFGINMMTLSDAMQEKLTVRGDLQLGRVPVGRSSALRTSQNLQSLLEAGEARPQRILRRFLMGWIEIFKQIHEMNQHFLTDGKKFRIIGIRDPNEDPYKEVETQRDLAGRFQFDFSVNILNASKIGQQQSLEKLFSLYVSPIALQLGIVDPNSVYRLLRDMGKAYGQKPESYLNEPSPDAFLPPILAEEAITQIISGEMPGGTPMEGAQKHMDKLMQFMQSDQFGFLDTPGKVDLFRSYIKQVSQMLKLEAQSKAAGATGGGMSGGGASPTGGPPPNLGPPQISGEGELLDETLPGAGGGANGAGQ